MLTRGVRSQGKLFKEKKKLSEKNQNVCGNTEYFAYNFHLII